jgi:predicted nucleotidyltransferase
MEICLESVFPLFLRLQLYALCPMLFAQRGDNMRRERVLAVLSNSQDVLRRFSVKNLYLFGSVARGEGQEGSDVDILVEYDPGVRVGLFQFVRLRRELSKRLGCKVDLATPDSLHKELRDGILQEAIHAA